MELSIEILGLAAGACTTFSFLPQVIKVWRTRSTEDISLIMYIVFCLGVFLWILYGFCVNAISIVLANMITFMLASSILGMKLFLRK